MEREWRTISQNPNYEVSNLGEVRCKKTNKIRKLRITPLGYIELQIRNRGKKRMSLKVHRLVAQAFIPNPFNKPCVNHKDFNRANNRVDNLEWVTYSENQYWSSENSRKARLGKKRGSFSSEARKNISKGRLAHQNRPYPAYIYKTPNGYVVKIKRNCKAVFTKNSKTLEQAIENKAKWIEENKEVFNFT